MKEEIKIDKYGRLTIPSHFRNAIELKEDVTIELDKSKGTIIIYNYKYKSKVDLINSRLNKKDITISERKFLEKLLEN